MSIVVQIQKGFCPPLLTRHSALGWGSVSVSHGIQLMLRPLSPSPLSSLPPFLSLLSLPLSLLHSSLSLSISLFVSQPDTVSATIDLSISSSNGRKKDDSSLHGEGKV